MRINWFSIPKATLTGVVCSLCLTAGVFAQIKPLIKTGVTRAVVIGISDYQNPKIPHLQYAHLDAMAFADFLRTKGGGEVAPENIKLLTNAQATLGEIIGALYWLAEASQPQDRAIIYFSGHGDMESKVVKNLGVLLAYDAPPTSYLAGGALQLRNLEEIIQSLSTDRQTQVLLITDACRSGHLAGSLINGAQLTAEALMARMNNVVRLLSCQPTEYSVEGRQWGGGRGAFSFHLINGLTGLADQDHNEAVNVREIQDYLQKIVPAETAPQQQFPIAVGNLTAVINGVDPIQLADLQTRLEKQSPPLAFVNTKSLEAGLLSQVDTTIQELYDLFNKALAAGHLLEPAEGSAYQLYQRLAGEESIRDLQGLMRRNLATALQDDAQQAINDYLTADPRELAARWQKDPRYDRYPEYLAKAAELLGETSTFYPSLMARYHYFQGVNWRRAADNQKNADLFRKAMTEQQEALKFEPNAAYALNEIGVLFHKQLKYDQALPFLQRAHALSPTWSLPLNNLCATYLSLEQLDSAEVYGLQALAINPDLVLMYVNLGTLAQKKGNYKQAEAYYRQALEKDPSFYLVRQELAFLFWGQKEYAKADQEILAFIREQPANPWAYNQRALIQRDKGDLTLSEQLFRKAIEVNPNWPYAYYNLGNLLLKNLRRYPEAEQQFLHYLTLEPNDVDAFEQLAYVSALQGRLDQSAAWLDKALAAGLSDKAWKKTQDDPALAPLRETAAYQALLQKYPRGK